jgi:predicted RNase H-like nuclease (RuvC/YqgF family)
MADRARVASRPESSEDELESLKRSVQELRRRTTLLTADLHRQVEAREALEARLIEAHAEIEASRARRKEMARVITARNAEIQARYEELAALQRHIVQSSPWWKVKASARWVWRRARRAFKG